jgi:hypothetical protein
MNSDMKKLEILLSELKEFDRIEIKKVGGKIEIIHKENKKYIIDQPDIIKV